MNAFAMVHIACVVFALLMPCVASPVYATVASRSTNDTGMILFSTPDGRTLKRVRPDGRSIETLIVAKQPLWYQISPNGDALLYDAGSGITLLQQGHHRALRLPTMTAVQWLDERRFFGVIANKQHRYFSHIYVYDLLSRRGTILSRIPSLIDIQLSPKRNRLVGTIDDTQYPYNGYVYLYDFGTRYGKVLPLQGLARWFPDNENLLYQQSEVSRVSWISEDVHTDDLYRYTLTTGKITRLTHLRDTTITFARGDKGTDAWRMFNYQVFPDGQTIAFSGWPQHLAPGAGMNTTFWYRILVSGLPITQEPPLLVASNLTLLVHPTLPLALVSGTYHSDACFNPKGIGLVELEKQTQANLYVNIPRPNMPQNVSVGVNLYGFDWSPHATQVVVAAQPYSCSGAGVEQQLLAPPRIYLWDVTLDPKVNKVAQARAIALGISPMWVKQGWLSH